METKIKDNYRLKWNWSGCSVQFGEGYLEVEDWERKIARSDTFTLRTVP